MSLIRQLKNESEGPEPLRAVSLRLPDATYQEMVTLARREGIKVAVLLRHCVLEGWKRVKAED